MLMLISHYKVIACRFAVAVFELYNWRQYLKNGLKDVVAIEITMEVCSLDQVQRPRTNLIYTKSSNNLLLYEDVH